MITIIMIMTLIIIVVPPGDPEGGGQRCRGDVQGQGEPYYDTNDTSTTTNDTSATRTRRAV